MKTKKPLELQTCPPSDKTETQTTDFMAYVLRKLQENIEHGKREKAEFLEDATEDPLHAIKWLSLRGMTDAYVAEYALKALTHKESPATLAGVRSEAAKRMMNKIMWPPSSTSQFSNLVETYEGSAWARLVELFDEAV